MDCVYMTKKEFTLNFEQGFLMGKLSRRCLKSGAMRCVANVLSRLRTSMTHYSGRSMHNCKYTGEEKTDYHIRFNERKLLAWLKKRMK